MKDNITKIREQETNTNDNTKMTNHYFHCGP